MAVSVIVSNFNGARYLPRLLETLKAQQGVAVEIIVVDRYSTDDSLAILGRHPDVKVVKEPPESGLVAGYAVGVRYAHYEHLFFCNEDMWFDKDCLACLEKQIDLALRVACANPWQWTYDGSRVIHSAPQIRKGWSRGEINPFHSQVQNQSIPSGCVVAGACAGAMMIHRIAYADVGEWDTTFFLDYEDTDLAIRLWQRGWLTITVPEARVYHAVGASNSKVISKGKVVVGKKRYIFGGSNRIIVGWKTFSVAYWCLVLLPWFETILRNALRLRMQIVLWDIFVLTISLRRLRHVLVFRRSNRTVNRQRPGQLFYMEKHFQYGTIVRPSEIVLRCEEVCLTSSYPSLS